MPRSVRRALGRGRYEIRVDAAFGEVAAACAEDREGVWLTPRLGEAYGALHRLGLAHSVEAWSGGRLAGGLFGVALGGLFTSESMFHREPDAGNAALVGTAALLAERGFALWDIQMSSPHTARFGAVDSAPRVPRPSEEAWPWTARSTRPGARACSAHMRGRRGSTAGRGQGAAPGARHRRRSRRRSARRRASAPTRAAAMPKTRAISAS